MKPIKQEFQNDDSRQGIGRVFCKGRQSGTVGILHLETKKVKGRVRVQRTRPLHFLFKIPHGAFMPHAVPIKTIYKLISVK